MGVTSAETSTSEEAVRSSLSPESRLNRTGAADQSIRALESHESSRTANGRNPIGRIVRAVISIVLLVFLGLAVWPTSKGGPLTFAIVSGESMEPGYHTGDLLIAVRKFDGYQVGDSIVYMVDDERLRGRVVHRITAELPNGNFLTRGDNKPFNDPWEVRSEWILGEVKLLIPQVYTALRIMASPIFLGTIFGLFVVLLLWPRNDDNELTDPRVQSVVSEPVGER